MTAMRDNLNIEFKFYADTPPAKDPDSHSPTLRRYHKMLWSKELPNGHTLDLVDTHAKSYLYHNSNLGEFFMSSDSITHSYRDAKRIAHIIEQTPAETVASLFDCGSTIGAYIIFPGNKIENKMTINCARGLSSKIVDRFDLTLECIRRYYEKLESPLGATLSRYSNFFSLFNDFKGYIDFFLLQDLVTSDYAKINFHLSHNCFEDDPLPKSKEDYLIYLERTVDFVTARAARMQESL